jgi:hypothetical protein
MTTPTPPSTPTTYLEDAAEQLASSKTMSARELGNGGRSARTAVQQSTAAALIAVGQLVQQMAGNLANLAGVMDADSGEYTPSQLLAAVQAVQAVAADPQEVAPTLVDTPPTQPPSVDTPAGTTTSAPELVDDLAPAFAWQDGYDAGRLSGYQEAYPTAWLAGHDDGYQAGHASGWAAAVAQVHHDVLEVIAGVLSGTEAT